MEILQRAIKRMPSFWVVDMPPDRRIPFGVDEEKLMKLGRTKNRGILVELGGVEGIISALNSSACFGIRGDAADVRHRMDVFGSNSFRKPGISRFMYSIFCEMKEFSAAMTLLCAAFLVVVGIMAYGRQYGWEEGVYALVFSFVYFVFAAIVEFGLQAYFGKVKKSGHVVVVLRNGLKQQIPFSGVVVGDIVCLKSGDKIPADGLFLDGDQSVKLDESHLMGIGEIVEVDHSNPFLSAATKLVEGRARMMVTGVGKNTICYEKRALLYHQDVTRLEAEVHVLAKYLERAKWILAFSFLPISLARYFSGNAKDGDGNSEFNQGTTTVQEVSYALVSILLNVAAISIAMDTTNFSWAVEVGLAHAISEMSSHNVMVRSLSAWEKIGLGAAKVNVIDGSNTFTKNQMEASKFLFVPQFAENREAPSLISPNVLELIQQGIGLNTTGIAYNLVKTHKHEFSGSHSERAILSRAALELGMDWERLNQDCNVLKVEALEMQCRGILLRKGDAYHVHRRGRADVILEMCSSFYDASGSLSSLNEDTRNLLEGKLQSINLGGKIHVTALAHRQVTEEELINDSDLNEKQACYALLGFVALKETSQDGILKKVLKEYLNRGVGISGITKENSVDGAVDSKVLESGQGLKDETFAEETVTGEDDTSVCTGSGGEETTESRNDTDTSDRRADSASMDRLKVAKFCLVEELTGSEALGSTSPVILELLNQGICGNTTENVISCNDLSESPIERAIISWAIHELNLDSEELEKYFPICRSENFNPENQGLGFLMSMENGTFCMHKKGSADNILTMCSSYYGATGEKCVFEDQERTLLERKVQDLESCNCHWVAVVHSLVSQEERPGGNSDLDTAQDSWILLGILVLHNEHEEVKDENECSSDDILVSETIDNGVVSKPSQDVDRANNGTRAEEVTVTSEANVLVSMGIEGDQETTTSTIVILDGKYSSLTLILRWASCIFCNTQLFLQFQLTTSITSILNTYIEIVSLPGTPGVDTRLVYVLVQLIWVNLGMGLVAAVTFGRQKPKPSDYLSKKPVAEGSKRQLVTGFMWRNIIAQVAYQILVISMLQFQGSTIFGFNDDVNDTTNLVMPIFLQVFNMINARKIEEKNIFSGIRPSFIYLVGILMVVPIVLVQFLAWIAHFQGLDWKQWTICIGIAMVSWPVAFAVKFVPVRVFISPSMTLLNKIKGLLRHLRH
ncbi:Calcium-transporting ATPase 12, plasma membrane-type [Sesamum alatum]|uniref:Calcium-transporting ATPase 12, plasma membrane-type n=1 Tax=Sesamum alatum TaxID=300844 RepID=A0AAE2CKL2_9LAMI|nr:Calcium-transporting ATPase 12, plasma membrane-type [Sesamum alatum]